MSVVLTGHFTLSGGTVLDVSATIAEPDFSAFAGFSFDITGPTGVTLTGSTYDPTGAPPSTATYHGVTDCVNWNVVVHPKFVGAGAPEMVSWNGLLKRDGKEPGGTDTETLPTPLNLSVAV